ncbi:MAG: hypothetical protein ISR82_08030 [Candidatus Marinimicrobia bacterium]|nr:hypothetical protein [Candidatus Neomarinimicrobiota bacterium]MBL7011154.1 hypothetical protein [Candidatus Neomarinimicrobiota bacterium]MBL7031374.1 hypothetical protein [Candidatus Neomarinimicrobiota bacterium]
MRSILYVTAIALGIFGLGVGIRPDYTFEILLGIFLPYIVTTIELFFIFHVIKKEPQLTTKILMTGFVGKMIIFGIYLLIIFNFYSFAPYPFVISFAGSFLAFHTLEAFVLKSLY